MKASRWLPAITLAVCWGAAAFAQTTGRLEGRITSSDGSPLPGVTVTVSSPSLQGERVQVTDERGEFRFPALPPGTYHLRTLLEGFNPVELPDVNVGIERTTNITIPLSTVVEEEITVTSEAPVVDTTSSASGVNVGQEVFEQIPVGRDFYSVAQVAPGANQDREGPALVGATSVENQYIIEGLNTTGVELGQPIKQLNFEFIDEVQVISGGLPAEYGRLTGGVINAITKSGGNDYRGDVFGYLRNEDLQTDNTMQSELRADAFQVVETAEQQDYGFDLGGFILRD